MWVLELEEGLYYKNPHLKESNNHWNLQIGDGVCFPNVLTHNLDINFSITSHINEAILLDKQFTISEHIKKLYPNHKLREFKVELI